MKRITDILRTTRQVKGYRPGFIDRRERRKEIIKIEESLKHLDQKVDELEHKIDRVFQIVSMRGQGARDDV